MGFIGGGVAGYAVGSVGSCMIGGESGEKVLMCSMVTGAVGGSVAGTILIDEARRTEQIPGKGKGKGQSNNEL